MGIIMRNGVAYGGGGGDNSTFIGTTAQWEALTTSEKAQYNIVDFTDDYSPGNGFRPLLIIYTDTGSTVTVSKTGISVTAEEVSEGKFVADIPEWGTYTITAVLDSSEITEEIIINTIQIYEVNLGSVIPEGSTVTPTDDIQIWLACANLNKPYTTLAEVLADRETFETLIADSNACDYMARSTTWALNSGAVPTMTSDTTPSGTVIYSSQSSGTDGYKAFDKLDSGYWIPTTSATNNYLGYTFDTPQVVNKVTIRTRKVSSQARTLKIEKLISNTWTEVGSVDVTAGTSTVTFVDYEAYIQDDTPSTSYRIFCSSTLYVTSSWALGIAELQFFTDADITTNQDAMSLIGKYDYCSNALLGNATWAEAIANSDYWDSVLQPLVPVMTSNTTPSGTASAYSQASGYEAYRVFDRDDSTRYYSNNTGSGGSTNEWIQYQFTESTKIFKVKIRADMYNSNRTCYTNTLQGSNDGTTFTDIAVLGQNIATSIQEYFTNISNANYSIYRVKGRTGASSARFAFYEIQFYGRASKEVLVPLVPTMTSNTTPSGECITDSTNSSFPAYGAFDKVTSSSGWNSGHQWAGNASSQYLGYVFTNSVCVNRLMIKPVYNSGTRVKGFAVYGSNDSSQQGTKLYEGEVSSGSSSVEYYFDIPNTNYYSVYKVYITTTDWSGNYGAIDEMQFYTKTVQTNIIHSCPNDTIYTYDEGSPVVLATTNSDGDGILDFSSLEDKVYALYSTVAQNPNDLTLPFARRIRITKSQYGGTTERYLVPDTIRTLYWYGYKNNIESMVTSNGWSRSSYTFNAPTYNTINVDCNANGSTVINGVSSTYKPTVMDRMCTLATGVTAVNSSYGNIKTEPSKAVDGSSATRQTLYDTNTLKFYVNNNPIENNYFTSYAIANRRYTLHGMWYENTIETPTFISAVYDSLYIMDGNTKIWIANTDGEGKSLAPMLEPGTYTIYSSVAKDPNNLSNPYSKTITVDESTQTIAVMPSNVLYWYGYMDDELEIISTANGWTHTNYTFTNPTFNVNSARFSSSSGVECGIGTKSTINATKAYMLATGITIASTQYGFMGLISAKNTGSVGTPTYIDSTSQKLYTFTGDGTSKYLYNATANARVFDLFALWYE